MSTPADFQVDPAQIRSHANTVGDIAGGLSSAAGGLPDGLSDNALGTFVQFVTAGLGTAMTQTLEAITQAASAVDSVRDALARTADDYQRADEHNAELLLGKDGR
jgi:excreted virulence factor EspC (type VII ESX diderm)